MTFTPLRTEQVDGFAARLAAFAQEVSDERNCSASASGWGGCPPRSAIGCRPT